MTLKFDQPDYESVDILVDSSYVSLCQGSTIIIRKSELSRFIHELKVIENEQQRRAI